MAQISYGTITITDTTDIERIYLIYKSSTDKNTPPQIVWSNGTNDWVEDITDVDDNPYIWAITVFKHTDIPITSQNYTNYYSDPVCLTSVDGQPGKGVAQINSYFTISSQSSGLTRNDTKYVYEMVVDPDSTSNPYELGYYEYNENSGYILTTDTVVITGKLYYIRNSISIWSTECPLATTEEPYLWEYQEIIYTEGNPTYTNPRVSRMRGIDGADGADGNDGVSVQDSRIIYYFDSTGNTPPLLPSDPNCPDDSVYTTDMPNVWTISIPTYQLGGQYYQCVETTYDTGNVIYSGLSINNALSHSQQMLAQLANIGNHAFQYNNGPWIVAGGSGDNVHNINTSDLTTYGYNTSMDRNGFGINYNAHRFVDINNQGITLFSNPIDINNNTVQGTPLITINRQNGISMYAPPEQGDIMVPGSELMNLNSDGLTFKAKEYNLTEDNQVETGKIYYEFDSINNKYVPITPITGVNPSEEGYYELRTSTVATYGKNIVIGDLSGYHIQIDSDELGFYFNENRTAYINNDQLYIGKTVVINEMLVGINNQTPEWAWAYDNSDQSIYLKWIGQDIEGE